MPAPKTLSPTLFTRKKLMASSLVLSALLLLPSAHARTFTVNMASEGLDHTPGDGKCEITGGLNNCSLRAAIQEANAYPGDDVINLGTHNPSLSISGRGENSAAKGDLDITDNLTINGGGIDSPNEINGNRRDRIFHIIGDTTVIINNVRITNGQVGLTGGGVQVDAGATVTINDSIIDNNMAYTSQNPDPDPNVLNTSPGDISTVATGGGVYVAEGGTLTLQGVQVSENVGTTAGGGVDNFGHTVIRSNSVVDGNLTNGIGGGIRNFGGTLAIADTVVSNNTATGSGAGILSAAAAQNTGASVITNSTIKANISQQIAGGIYNAGPMKINHSTIHDNTGGFDGGGVYIGALGSLELNNSTVSNNRSTRNGGGIFNSRSLSVFSSTIYNNSAGGLGDAPVYGGNQIAFVHTQPGYTINDPNAEFNNSIIASDNPSRPACAGPTGFQSFISSMGNNLESSNSCGLTRTTDIINTVPLLDVLAIDTANDAKTATHALLAGSPAINRGSGCPQIDQRFMQRVSPCDIGAFEWGATEKRPDNYVDLSLEITDNRDPVAVDSETQPLTYTFTIFNNYDNVRAQDVILEINLPISASYRHYNVVGNDNVTCWAPNAINEMNCDLGSLEGLDMVQIFVTVVPTAKGTINASAKVSSFTPDAFILNNSASESTDVVGSSNNGGVVNFGDTGGGGGGTSQPLLWLLISLGGLLLRRRYQAG